MWPVGPGCLDSVLAGCGPSSVALCLTHSPVKGNDGGGTPGPGFWKGLSEFMHRVLRAAPHMRYTPTEYLFFPAGAFLCSSNSTTEGLCQVPLTSLLLPLLTTPHPAFPTTQAPWHSEALPRGLAMLRQLPGPQLIQTRLRLWVSFPGASDLGVRK